MATATALGMAQATAHKKGRNGRKFLIILLTLIMLLMLLAVSRTPSPAFTAPPSASEAVAARQAFRRLQRANDRQGAQPLSLSWAELSSLAKMGGRAAQIDNAAIDAEDGRLRARGSISIPLGLWLNGTIWATPNAGAPPELDAKVGSLPLPPSIVRAGIGLARWLLKQRGLEAPEYERLVQSLTISAKGVDAMVDLPRNSKLLQALNGVSAEPIDPLAVNRLTCALVAAQRQEPVTELSALLRRSFADAGQSPGEHRARLVALAMMGVSSRVGAMVGSRSQRVKACPTGGWTFTLLGREDLAKHWLLSAALTATYGPNVSDVMGTWKEVSDSAPQGSGFSYVDLAADRSGTLAASRLSDPASASAMQSWLSTATPEALLPVSDLALAEGLSEAEFVARYRDIDSGDYRKSVARIDRALLEAFN